LDDTIWFALLKALARLHVAIHRPNHEIFDISHLWLVVDLIDEPGFFLSVVANVEVARHENLAAKADVWGEDDEVLRLLLVKRLQTLRIRLRLIEVLNLLGALFLVFHRSGGRLNFFEQGGGGHVDGSLRVVRQARLVVVIAQVVGSFFLTFVKL